MGAPIVGRTLSKSAIARAARLESLAKEASGLLTSGGASQGLWRVAWATADRPEPFEFAQKAIPLLRALRFHSRGKVRRHGNPKYGPGASLDQRKTLWDEVSLRDALIRSGHLDQKANVGSSLPL